MNEQMEILQGFCLVFKGAYLNYRMRFKLKFCVSIFDCNTPGFATIRMCDQEFLCLILDKDLEMTIRIGESVGGR